MFRGRGWDNPPIFDKTPVHISGNRGIEIDIWINNFSGEIDSYAIIDDDSDMLDTQINNFVQTSWDYGITPVSILKLHNILNQGD